MAENNINAFCKVCGNGYHACNSCKEQKTFTPWRAITDSVEHYKIFLAVHGYTLTQNKEIAKRELENCDLTGLETFNPEIQAAIKTILAEEPQGKSIPKKVNKPRDNKSKQELVNSKFESA